MSIKTVLAFLVILCCSLALAVPDAADAARMGGGRSFGGKPFMSTPAPRPATPQTPGMNRQQTQQPGAAATATRPGMFGGMGGLFGGLLAGTLIGSLLSGHGFAGGGLMDILIFGLLIYLGLKLFASFRSARRTQPAAAGADGATQQFRAEEPLRRDTVGNGWDVLRSPAQDGGQAASAGPQISVPAGFDTEEFLRGAKMAYTRLQSSWDKRDMADIAQFATPAVQQVVREQMAADPNPSRTEILLVNAQLLGVTNEGDDQYAQVFFDVLLRESPDQQTPSSAREIWHFVRPVAGGNWKLDGIQQVE